MNLIKIMLDKVIKIWMVMKFEESGLYILRQNKAKEITVTIF